MSRGNPYYKGWGRVMPRFGRSGFARGASMSGWTWAIATGGRSQQGYGIVIGRYFLGIVVVQRSHRRATP